MKKIRTKLLSSGNIAFLKPSALMRITGMLLSAFLLLFLPACSKGKETSADVTGKYNCIAVAEDGTSFTAPENEASYVLLKKGGKGEISDELSFELTWSLDGETFSATYKIFGIDAPLTGTLKDGILEVTDDGIVSRYLKEGQAMPDWAKDLEAAPNTDGRLAGHYGLYAMNISGQYYDYATLVEMGEMDSSYLQIDYDPSKGYTGELCFDGEEPDSFTLNELDGLLTFSDGTQLAYYESEKEEGVLSVIFEELDGTIFYALDSVERPTQADDARTDATDASQTDSLRDWWNRDWYGWWYMYGCKGEYADLEGDYWDCEAHIEIGDNYLGTMELWDDQFSRSDDGIGQVSVSLSENGTGEYGTLMSEGGWFMEAALQHADWIIDPALSDFENMFLITGSYDDDNGNVYYYKLILRPWGQLWDDVDPDSRPYTYEDWYLPMIQDGVTKMSERFGESDPSVYENLPESTDEEKGASETGETTSSADYGKSTADATGQMELEALKAGYDAVYDASHDSTLFYEDVRDIMGCDGLPFRFKENYHSYTWESGSVIVTVTFRVLDDGQEKYSAIAITGV